tara:strand:- start:966 stop:1391 length:426 start_codon:yes stop_codon:yes gene_type:complete
MSGYADLNGRISLALSRCQEQPWLDFKESKPWFTLRWRMLKTIMGMANLRDGGLILIGVGEKGTAWELMLTTDVDRMWSQHCAASEDNLNKTWSVSSESLVSDSLEHSLKAIVWLVECLGWMSPNEDSIRSDQQKLISGRL